MKAQHQLSKLGPRLGLAAALLATAAGSSGCALFASANAAHSHITPCVDEMAFSITDLVLAAASTAIVVGTGAVDDSMAWMLVPGTFAASGVIGSIFVHKCRGDLNRAREAPMPVYPVVNETPTSLLPDATPEELGEIEAPPPPDPRLQLSPNSTLGEMPKEKEGEGDNPPPTLAPPDDPSQQKIMCGIDMPNVCPVGQSCVIVAAMRGYCAADPKSKHAP